MPTHRSSTLCLEQELDRVQVSRHIFAGLAASLVSIGLARFAFTPLIPVLIREHWFVSSQVIYLGSANLLGYVIGALTGRSIGGRLRNENALRLMMLLITAAFLACAVPLSFAWYYAWRFISGIAGGVVMVLLAGTLLPHIPKHRRGAAGGAIFLGLGLGIAGSGTLIPLLLNLGVRATWIGLALVSALLSAASWFAWPESKITTAHPEQDAHHPQDAHPRVRTDLRILYVQYALMAAAAVPPMVFLVDFISRGLGAGTRTGAVFWVIYGMGAITGPPLYGYLADHLRPRRAMVVINCVQALALFALYPISSLPALGALTFLIGSFAPGMVPLVLARVRELIAQDAHRQNVAWSRATIIGAVAIALAGYGFSSLLNASGGDHRLLFLTATAMLLITLLGDLLRMAR